MRRKGDAYYTPRKAVETLIRYRPEFGRSDGTVVEPCVGEGAIADVFRERGCDVVTGDLAFQCVADVHGDARHASTWELLRRCAAHTPDMAGRIDRVVTNPPFSDALAIAQQAIENAAEAVALFLRLSFLEPTDDRGPWLSEHPPDDLIVLPRISFTGDGKTDSVTCGWIIWYTGDSRPIREHRIEIVPKG